MAQRTIHANLTSSSFPFDFRELSSTIVQTDTFEQNRQIIQGFSGEGAELSAGIPQAYYLQNCLPISRGFSSVHFYRSLPAATGESVTVDDAYVVTDILNNVALFSPANGNNLLFDPETQKWFRETNVTFASERVTVATLKGITYICYPGVGLFVYNFADKVLEQQTLEGINFAEVQGVLAANSNLVLWTNDALYWSSVLDPLDFEPSQETGAGTTQVLALRGIIVTCKAIGDGFIIYTTRNAVGAQYTGNIAFPWAYKEVENSVGIQEAGHVAAADSSAYHIAWTASGLMEVTYKKASLIWTELSESIQRGVFTTSNMANLPVIASVDKLDVKLGSVGSEYITISIRPKDAIAYETAYVFDMALQRWGKIDVPHACFLEYSIPQFARQLTYQDFADMFLRYSSIPEDFLYEDLGTEQERQPSVPGKNFGMVTPAGGVFLVTLANRIYPNPYNTEDPLGYLEAGAREPAIVLGKYKFQRSHGVRLEWLNMSRRLNATVSAFGHDYTGRFVLSQDTFVQHPKVPDRLYGRLTGDSVSICFSGAFVLTDLSITVGDAGKRVMPALAEGVKQVVIERIPVVIDGVQVTGVW